MSREVGTSPSGEAVSDEEARARHVGRLLLRAHRDFSARAISGLHRAGHHSITLAHLNLLPHLDGAGTRVTVLAERAGMTKQGMGQLIQDVERLGYAARAPDPTDGRASLVTFTRAGRQLLSDAIAVTQQVQMEYEAILGPERLVALKQALADITDHSAHCRALASDQASEADDRSRERRG